MQQLYALEGLTYCDCELQPLTVSDVEHYGDSTQQTEGKRVVSEQSERLEPEPSVGKSKFLLFISKKSIWLQPFYFMYQLAHGVHPIKMCINGSVVHSFLGSTF